MLKKILNKIWRSEGQEGVETPADEQAVFELKYKNLLVGVLSLSNGVWKFTYSEQFRQQQELTPLVDFPNLDHAYESHQLWPFFSYRIPGLSQPTVQAIIKKKAIDPKNEVALLRQFGKSAVFNPFLLHPPA